MLFHQISLLDANGRAKAGHCFCVNCKAYLLITAGLEMSSCSISFKKQEKTYQNKSHYMIWITCISLNLVAFLFKHKSTSPALQHGVTETLALTVACLLIINPVTAENSDVQPAWKDSLCRFSSFSLFLMCEKSARRPWLLRRRVVARLVFVGCSCGSDHVADEIWLLH